MNLLRKRWPEISIFLVGCALRWSMLRSFSVYGGYDYGSHHAYVEWFATHGSLPDPFLSRETFQPPLYYALAAWWERAGLLLGALSVAMGCVRLWIVWAGFERLWPAETVARRVALALAAVLPSAVHLDGMASNEALNALLGTAAIAVAALALPADGRRRWTLAMVVGLLCGLELLTKVSALTVVAAIGVAAIADWVWRRGRWLPFVAAAGLTVALSGWFYARNQTRYGKPFVTSFDFKEQFVLKSIEDVPYFKRRDAGFLLGWSAEIYQSPFYPAALEPPRFFPVLIATTFVDYYNYRYCWTVEDPDLKVVGRGTRPGALLLAPLAALGGTVIAAATVAAWIVAMAGARRRRRAGELALLLSPAFALAGAIHFATAYPFDSLGHIKGTFLQYAAAPLCGLFGWAVGWSWQKRRALALVQIGALILVAAYSIYCRWG